MDFILACFTAIPGFEQLVAAGGFEWSVENGEASAFFAEFLAYAGSQTAWSVMNLGSILL